MIARAFILILILTALVALAVIDPATLPRPSDVDPQTSEGP